MSKCTHRLYVKPGRLSKTTSRSGVVSRVSWSALDNHRSKSLHGRAERERAALVLHIVSRQLVFMKAAQWKQAQPERINANIIN